MATDSAEPFVGQGFSGSDSFHWVSPSLNVSRPIRALGVNAHPRTHGAVR